MITVLHGENILASRRVLGEKINNFKKEVSGEIIRVDGSKAKMEEMIQALESQSLFFKEKLVVVENLFGAKSMKFKKEVFDYLLEGQKFPEVIIWEGKQVSGNWQKKLGQKAKFFEFKIPTTIFKFVDSIRPKNTRAMLFGLHECLKTDGAEMVFYMLIRQIRLLILAKEGGNNLSSMPEWMRGKFLRQAQSFKEEELLKIYEKLLEIDVAQKTGKLILPLEGTLDLLMASI